MLLMFVPHFSKTSNGLPVTPVRFSYESDYLLGTGNDYYDVGQASYSVGRLTEIERERVSTLGRGGIVACIFSLELKYSKNPRVRTYIFSS